MNTGSDYYFDRTGADLKLIQSLMRHSNVSVTADRNVQISNVSKERSAVEHFEPLAITVPKLWPDCAAGPLNY